MTPRVALPLVLTLALSACDGTGTFDPNQGVDAGPGGNNGVSVDDIGKPCTYDPNNPSNPTNDCAKGLSCLIFTSDQTIQSGLTLSAWEDQFTVYNETPRTDVGYCTLLGTDPAPPVCPAGSVLKLLSTNVAVCVRTCTQPGDCGRSDYTCDGRYLDTQPNLCVKRCAFDVPDCVRSGIIVNPQDGQTLLPALAFQDLAGDRQCDTTTGQCVGVGQHGIAGPGEACATTQDCEAGAACLQAPILDAVLGRNDVSTGFCASPCTAVPNPQTPQDAQSNCSTSYICQSAGVLNLGFQDPAQGVPGPIVVDVTSGAIEFRGGFCFHQCAVAVQAACGPFPGTSCGSLDEAHVGDLWNNVPMCLPQSIVN